VIGVSSSGQTDSLRNEGADLVVTLGEILDRRRAA
jgi:hypothetical protein